MPLKKDTKLKNKNLLATEPQDYHRCKMVAVLWSSKAEKAFYTPTLTQTHR